MRPERRARFQALLEGERERMLALLAAAAAIPGTVADAAPGEESVVGIGGATLVDDTAVIARESAALADVERALQQLRDDPDSYGTCIECGNPIALGRLELIPTARRCARHSEAAV